MRERQRGREREGEGKTDRERDRERERKVYSGANPVNEEDPEHDRATQV